MNNNLKIMDLPKEERPKEKLLTYGAETLSNSELLAIILRCGVKGENVLTLSQRVLSTLNGLDGILNTSYNEITTIKGIKDGKASQILAIAEMYKRFNNLKADDEKVKVNSPGDIAQKLIAEMGCYKQEVLKLIILNTKNKIIRIKDIFKGSLNTSIVHPREIYSEAVKYHGASIIICHNHPSGDPTPSAEDINITLRINECGKLIGINLLDHIIIGSTNYISMKEKGII